MSHLKYRLSCYLKCHLKPVALKAKHPAQRVSRLVWMAWTAWMAWHLSSGRCLPAALLKAQAQTESKAYL